MTAQPTDRPAAPPAWEPSDPYVWIRLPHGAGPDGYREAARVTGDETFAATAPFPVSITLR